MTMEDKSASAAVAPSQPPTVKPVVAIVGRPNVGKSTLFNRLVGKRVALVEGAPGTTRDRLYAPVEWGEHSFTLVDMGGLDPAERSGYAPLVGQQALLAIAEADALLLVVDAPAGPTALDRELAELLREADRPVLLVANKADNDERQEAAVQFYELGLGEPVPVSAYHGLGIDEMMRRLLALLPARAATALTAEALPIAIVGRPNVGKSLLLNAILGQERVIVSQEPGTTRDAVDTFFDYRGQPLVLIDTAGIRRRGKVEPGVEKHSLLRTESALERAEVAVLVLDASEGVTAQDAHIAGYAIEAYKGLVLALNKWDLVADGQAAQEEYVRQVRARLRFAPWASLSFVSAKEARGVEGLLETALAAAAERRRRVRTAEVNEVLLKAVADHPAASRQGRRLKLLYATQAAVSPPTFVLFVNDPTLLHFSYRRYLENALRRAFGFAGTSLKLIIKGRGEG